MHQDESEKLRGRALAVIPGGANTLSKRPEAYAPGATPMFLQRGSGCRVWDVDNNEYIDYIGALGPVTLGYCYPEIDAAIVSQLKRGILFPFATDLEVRVSEKLVEILPGADWVRLFKTGAEATSAAVRVARAATGREVIVNYGYHGWHDTWTAERTAPADAGVPVALKNLIVPFVLGGAGESSLAAVLEANRGHVAAIMMEPVSYYHPEIGEALEQARQLADEHGALLIFDEIVSGFRVARGGAAEKYGVIPDLACWAKGMANGMPLAAVTGSASLADTMAQAIISSTYSGEALSLAACGACLSIYAEQDVVGHTTAMGNRLLDGLRTISRQHNLKVVIGGHPMMGGYIFQYEDPKLNHDLATLFMQEMANNGVLMRRNGLIFISYSHQQGDIDQTIAAAEKVMPVLKQAVEAGSAAQWLNSIHGLPTVSARQFPG